jgi:hypothetical protein
VLLGLEVQLEKEVLLVLRLIQAQRGKRVQQVPEAQLAGLALQVYQEQQLIQAQLEKQVQPVQLVRRQLSIGEENGGMQFTIL